ncbi:MAG TPA: hypothetical protein VGL48_19300 [Acidimicrobiales bacterium]|jgi:hypothetical protein
MSQNDEFSPDEPLGEEVFEQGDEAQSERARLDPDFVEDAETDPSLDPTLQVDDRELEEAGVRLDDPEDLATLDGGIDDPDGIAGRVRRPAADDEGAEGWDLDAPITRGDAEDGEEEELEGEGDG